MIASLRYVPTGRWVEDLHAMIVSCGVDPRSIILNYAYTAENIAMTTYNSIVIDPILWSTISDDPESIKIKEIFDAHIAPALSATQKDRLAQIKNIFSANAQRFVFKHELGHVVRNFSQKRLALVWAIGSSAAYAGITAAYMLLPLSGIFALLVGMFFGGVVDLFLTYSSNFFFKVYEEKQADLFAISFSSPEEIEAAALFFEQHQAIIDAQLEPGSLLHYLPSEIVSGHPNGNIRAAYIRSFLR